MSIFDLWEKTMLDIYSTIETSTQQKQQHKRSNQNVILSNAAVSWMVSYLVLRAEADNATNFSTDLLNTMIRMLEVYPTFLQPWYNPNKFVGYTSIKKSKITYLDILQTDAVMKVRQALWLESLNLLAYAKDFDLPSISYKDKNTPTRLYHKLLQVIFSGWPMYIFVINRV